MAYRAEAQIPRTLRGRFEGNLIYMFHYLAQVQHLRQSICELGYQKHGVLRHRWQNDYTTHMNFPAASLSSFLLVYGGSRTIYSASAWHWRTTGD
jgi:hypothetical protein